MLYFKNLILMLIVNHFYYINLFFYLTIILISWINLSFILKEFYFFYDQDRSYTEITRSINKYGLIIANFSNSLYVNVYNYYLNIIYSDSKEEVPSKIAENNIFIEYLANKTKFFFNSFVLTVSINILYCIICVLYMMNFDYSYNDFYIYYILSIPLSIFIIISNIIATSNFSYKEKILKQNLINFESIIRKKMDLY